MTDLRSLAIELGDRYGWSCFPTRLNSAGKFKLPKLRHLSDFTKLRPEQNGDHDWDSGGIAVALGDPSGGLGCIDVDHPALADFIQRKLQAQPNPPLMCGTPHGLHVFTLGENSFPRNLAVKHPGDAASRRYPVDLLSCGTYVVIPPALGYWWISDGAEPAYGSVFDVWQQLAHRFDMPYERARSYHFSNSNRGSSPRLSTAEISEAMDVRR